MLACFPKALRYWASSIYSFVTGFFESITIKIRWDSWIAAIHCLKIYSLRDSPAAAPFLRRLVSTPGVSITETNPCKIGNSLRSRVVPRCGSTIAILSPTKELKRLLFPQLGKPTKDTRNRPSPSTPLFQGLDWVFTRFYFSYFRISICSIWSWECKISCEFLALRLNV